uniref:CARD domain-containing protein n=1 Tax=Neogobius melanostomus TaxID=47308 RepID=A0A8C6URX7_9GOBI
MKPKDIIRRNKTSLLEILSADHMLILNKVQEHGIITDREYNNLKCINNKNVEGHLGELLDKLMNKGDETCQDFINLLKTDAMTKETFPNLKSIQWTVGNSGTVSVQKKSNKSSIRVNLLLEKHVTTDRPD